LEREKILREAKEKAEDILKDAEKKKEVMKNSFLKALEKKNNEKKQRLLCEISLQMKKELLLEKERLFRRIIDGIKQKLLNKKREIDAYYVILNKFFQEAAENFQSNTRFKLKVSQEDRKLCEKMISELNLNAEVEPTLSSSGGLILSDIEEKVIVDNTFESRLKKIVPELKEKLTFLMK